MTESNPTEVRKFCPVLSASFPVEDSGTAPAGGGVVSISRPRIIPMTMNVPCLGEGCAWWVGGDDPGCAIRGFSSNLVKVSG